MLNHCALAILAMTLVVSPATGQIRTTGSGTAGFGIGGGSGRGMGTGFKQSGMGGGVMRFDRGRGPNHRSVLLPYPYFYSDSDGAYAPEPASPPQVVVLPAAAPAIPEEAPAPRESLLIEWQGDRFVRTTMSAKSRAGEPIAPDYAEKRAAAAPRLTPSRLVPPGKETVQAARELPPAVLVYHDGRREQVSEYTIMNGTIYSKADYWSTGSWTRKIQVADLDVPATLKINQEQGVKFTLPGSPNEVIIRP